MDRNNPKPVPAKSKSTAKKSVKTRTSKNRSRRKKSVKKKLAFPVSDIHHMLAGGNYLKRVDNLVPIFLASAEEYVAHEIIELAGNHARNRNSNRIDVEDVDAAIRDDPELYKLFEDITDK